ncbi:MAG: alpha/beta hydrolase [Gammaproteobacteria bacterium]|nr:alpha/beta hydrolase [Gammaproteobacteria bacterium]
MEKMMISETACRATELDVMAAKVAESAARLPQIEEGTPEQARAFRAERGNPFAPAPCELHSIIDLNIPIRRGSVNARQYVPTADSVGRGCFVYFHGGGFVLSTVDDYDTVTQRLAMHSGRTVISIDYERAPENKIKSIHQDGYDAWCWIAEHGEELGIDSSRLAVGGDSAGGNLTVAVTLACKRNGAPMPVQQVLIYPSVDPTMKFPSIQEFASGYLLTRPGMDWFRSHYLESPEQVKDPELQFLKQDLSGLPSAILITAGFDPLRDEGQAYADRLQQFGVSVTHWCYTDMIHAFLSFAGGIAAGEDAIRRIGTSLKQVLA